MISFESSARIMREANEAIQMAFVQACEAVGIPFEAD